MTKPDNTAVPHERPNPDQLTLVLRWVVLGVAGLALVVGGGYGLARAMTPAPIAKPVTAHYHFRLQIINNDQPVDFSQTAYQTEFNKDICTAAITKEPVHFHDNLDQFVHIHWKGLTGGLVLKDYGWNLIGGANGLLGYKFNAGLMPQAVSIHGSVLPARPTNAHYYLYTGDAASYRERNFQDFLQQDLQTFFGDKTASAQPSWLDRLVPAAEAAGDSMTAMDMAATPKTEAELTRLNHVVGSAVLFVQATKPTGAQIKDRFDHLIPLPTSSCGG